MTSSDWADRLARYGVSQARAACIRSFRLLRSRNAGRAIVREAERRQSEIIVLGAPRAERPSRTIFSETVDYVLKNAPCRVMVAAGRKVAA